MLADTFGLGSVQGAWGRRQLLPLRLAVVTARRGGWVPAGSRPRRNVCAHKCACLCVGAEAEEKLAATSMLEGVALRADDIANGMLFLASDMGRCVNVGRRRGGRGIWLGGGGCSRLKRVQACVCGGELYDAGTVLSHRLRRLPCICRATTW